MVVTSWVNLRQYVTMNMNYSFDQKKSISGHMQLFLVEKYYLPSLLKTYVCHFTSFVRYYYYMDTNLLFIHCSNLKMTDKQAAEFSKTVCFGGHELICV